MRLAAFLCLVPILAFGQVPEWRPPYASSQSATVLKGDNYWSKATPSNANVLESQSLLVIAAINPSAIASTAIIDVAVAAANQPRYFIATTGSGRLDAFSRDNSGDIVRDSTLSLSIGSWQIVGFVALRGGNLQPFVGTTLATGVSMATVDSLVGMNSAVVGAKSSLASALAPFVGQIGAVQVVTFSSAPSDIANTIAYVNATWRKKGFPKSYSGGTIVLNVDWKAGGLDKSASANTLTPTASPGIIKFR